MRQDLIIQVQDSPFGPRVSGPDKDRVFYSRNGEQVWSSPELDVYVVPFANGVEIKIVTKTRTTQAMAQAA